ncbi:MAG TPA: SRPBCC family protein [Candidatus Obscuribacterales bacterium]
MGIQLSRLAAPAIIALAASAVLSSSAQARAGDPGASASVLINASPEVVWKAVHEERLHDPDLAYAKILGKRGNSSTMEEKFVSVPILGEVIAVLQENETPLKRIDYSLIRSDKFKRMEGSWSLTPVCGGKQTLLQLSSFLDVGVPFSQPFVRNATSRKIDRRLSNVKQVAEREQASLAGRQQGI